MATAAPPQKGLSLPFVDPTADAKPKTLNVVLYGPGGIGKTTSALGAPGPVVYANAEGPNAALFARKMYGNNHIREVEVNSKQDLEQIYLYLKDGGQGEKSLVIDSLGEVHARILKSIAGEDQTVTLQHRGDANDSMIAFLKLVRDLPVNVIVICHEVSIKDEASGVIERGPQVGTSNEKVQKQVTNLFADVVGYCGRVETDNGPEFHAQVVHGNGRYAKDRTDQLGVSARIDLPAWIAAWNAPLPDRNTNNNEETGSK